jgi:hypothetical protein
VHAPADEAFSGECQICQYYRLSPGMCPSGRFRRRGSSKDPSQLVPCLCHEA